MDKIIPIILAGGKGTRMKSSGPKVLVPLRGTPMIFYILDAVAGAGLATPSLVVIGHAGDTVRHTLGDNFHYVTQVKQMGTGHAVATALPYIPDTTSHVVVLYGDHPFMTSKTITALAATHLKEHNDITMGTVSLSDFEDERACFRDYGRIVRDAAGGVADSIEVKDATDEQKAITEVNPCYYCFAVDWLNRHIGMLKNENAQKEYYLTDLIRIARRNGGRIGSIDIPPRDAMGANTPEQLSTLERLL